MKRVDVHRKVRCHGAYRVEVMLHAVLITALH